ncbi:hypothetical protein Scep_007886 [Stephania cephalantha]|uniref:Myosin motor domain-containing protein n=1 Tax=Stephania cephalantha TaxID=152367 RepID=A0AAP0KCF0_9MAGN
MAKCLTNLGGGSALEEKLRYTHMILEAFENAKTFKHANSSQFGKLIDIHFKPTVLLEKMRVIQLAKGERSFRMFYQLCSGAPSSLKDCILLIDVSIHDEKQ